MKELYRMALAEALKLKRTLAFRLGFWAPAVIVLLVFGMYIGRGQKIDEPHPVTGFAQLVLTLWTIIMFPLYAALAAALLAAIEHQNESWKHLFALPVNRETIFEAKWIVGLGLLFLSSLIIPIGVSASAEILRLSKPGWSTSRLPIAMIFKGALMSFGAAGFLFSIQLWISLRWRSFLPGIVVAVVAVALMLITIPRGFVLFGSFFPWSLPAMAMAPHNPYRALAVTVGLLGGAFVGVIACWSLTRHEFI